MSHRIVWFDMPVTDLSRAMAFYTAVLNLKIKEQFQDVAVIEHLEGEVSGCLFKSNEPIPTEHGVLLYFNVSGRLDSAVAAVEDKGGRVEQAPHAIGQFGYRAIVTDSEGNRIALHSV